MSTSRCRWQNRRGARCRIPRTPPIPLHGPTITKASTVRRVPCLKTRQRRIRMMLQFSTILEWSTARWETRQTPSITLRRRSASLREHRPATTRTRRSPRCAYKPSVHSAGGRFICRPLCFALEGSAVHLELKITTLRVMQKKGALLGLPRTVLMTSLKPTSSLRSDDEQRQLHPVSRFLEEQDCSAPAWWPLPMPAQKLRSQCLPVPYLSGCS